MVKYQKRPSEADYISEINRLRTQNAYLIRIITGQQGSQSEKTPKKESFGAYKQLWGGKNTQDNLQLYNGSAFSQIRR